MRVKEEAGPYLVERQGKLLHIAGDHEILLLWKNRGYRCRGQEKMESITGSLGALD